MSTYPTALVTGATAGIGTAFCHALAASGHDLILVARDQERLVELAEHLSVAYTVSCSVIVADLADPNQLAAVEDCVEDGVDVLVNNAGFGLEARFDEGDREAEQALLDVLVTAPMRLCHAALPGMMERRKGQIINVSSVAGFVQTGTYSAAKAWLNSFSVWARRTYGKHGVQVLTLCPGFTKTEFHQRMGMTQRPGPRWLWLTPERVVNDALRDLAKGKALSVPGWHYRTLVFATRFLPRGAITGVRRR